MEELNELASMIESLPDPYRVSMRAALQRATAGMQKRRKILGFIQNSLGQLRLDMKYVLFDLEATRRERDEYKRRLEER